MATSSKSKQGKMFRTQVDLSADARQELVAHLNQMLADTFDLYSQTKQAHWNVKGKEFFQLHELFDVIAGEILAFVDEIAERATALGGYATGTARMAAANSRIQEYPTDAIDGLDHVEALVERIGDYANKVRAGIDEAEELGDKDTADLYTAISRVADKRLWFLEAHLQGAKD